MTQQGYLCRALLRAAVGVLLFLTADATAGPSPSERLAAQNPDFGVHEDSLAGRVHRIAFVPMTPWYTLDNARDSVRLYIETLIAERLRSAGFEVVDPAAGHRIGRALADSLGGPFNPRTARIDSERAATIQILLITALLQEQGADGLLHCGVEGSAAGGYSIFVVIDGREGFTIYRHQVELAAGASMGEALADHARSASAVAEVLDPFCEAVLRQ